MRYGSLCSGIGGLDLAVEEVFDAEPAWFCEADPHAREVLTRHWPDTVIWHDLKTQDWSTVEPVDLVCAGYPCQPFSHAGRRQGVDDPRHLWPYVADAVRVLRPRVCVFENVAGHLGLGFDQVLCDLAALGFDVEWGVVRASDAGACHRRERLFVVARHPERARADARTPAGRPRDATGESGSSVAADAESCRGPNEPNSSLGGGQPICAVPRTVDRVDAGSPAEGVHAGRRLATVVAASDSAHVGRERGGSTRDRGTRFENGGAVDWGDYRPAIERWGHVVGSPAPAPTDERGRLAVGFVEWMMGFDEGWVDGLSRTAALRCLGNACVPAQGVLALSCLRLPNNKEQ